MDKEMYLKDAKYKIGALKKAAEELRQMSDHFPAVYRNTSRILASIKMLELNVSDVLDMTRS